MDENQEKENQKIELLKEESKAHSVKDAAFASASLGIGENYVGAYAVALRASATEIGLLTSLPNLIAPLFQILTSRAMETASRKKISGKGILFQALMWPLMALSGFLFLKGVHNTPLFLVLAYTIYAAFGNFIVPAWSSWIGDLVPKKNMNAFLGARGRIGSITALTALIIGGVILDFFKKKSGTSETFIFIGFGILFLVALIFRLLSRHYLLKQYEPQFRFKRESYFSFWHFIKASHKRTYGVFSIYVALMVLATNIAAPFYTIYMLRDLNFSYIQFMLMQVVAMLAIFFYTPLWSAFANRYGNVKTLKITGLMIPIACFLWPASLFLSPPWNFYLLLFANFYGGFSWVGFNLSAGSYLYDATSPEKRSLCAAYSSVLNGIGVVLGTTIGSFIISKSGVTFINIIMFVSIVSGLARFAAYFAMASKLKEVRNISEVPRWRAIPLVGQAMEFPLILMSYLPISFKTRLRKNKQDMIE